MYQCAKFGVNRVKIGKLKIGKKPKLFLTSRDEKMVRRTSNLTKNDRKGYRQGTFCSKPEVAMLTGSKVMAHYVVLYIFGDLDLDLGPILAQFRLFQLEDKPDVL